MYIKIHLYTTKHQTGEAVWCWLEKTYLLKFVSLYSYIERECEIIADNF